MTSFLVLALVLAIIAAVLQQFLVPRVFNIVMIIFAVILLIRGLPLVGITLPK